MRGSASSIWSSFSIPTLGPNSTCLNDYRLLCLLWPSSNQAWTSHGLTFGQPFWFYAALANKPVPCNWLSSGALEVWTLRLRLAWFLLRLATVSDLIEYPRDRPSASYVPDWSQIVPGTSPIDIVCIVYDAEVLVVILPCVDRPYNLRIIWCKYSKLLSAHKSHVGIPSCSPSLHQIKSALTGLLVSFWCKVKIRGEAGETAWSYGCNRWWMVDMFWLRSRIGIG